MNVVDFFVLFKDLTPFFSFSIIVEFQDGARAAAVLTTQPVGTFLLRFSANAPGDFALALKGRSHSSKTQSQFDSLLLIVAPGKIEHYRLVRKMETISGRPTWEVFQKKVIQVAKKIRRLSLIDSLLPSQYLNMIQFVETFSKGDQVFDPDYPLLRFLEPQRTTKSFLLI
jgi:hypothetical protein